MLAAHLGAGPVPALAVDSVNVEIRDSLSAAASTKRAFAPAWLLTDGTIRDFLDTTKGLCRFRRRAHRQLLPRRQAPESPRRREFCSRRHRRQRGAVAYDFSTGQGKAFGIGAMVLTGTHYALISGNASNADQVINASDRVATRNNLGAANYNLADVNMDGVVNASDRVVVRNNLGKSSQVP